MRRQLFAGGVNRGAGDQSTAWAAPTLAASWANVAGYATAAYSRDNNGVVYLRGTIDSGTKAAGTVITTLPVGFRPVAKQVYPVVTNTETACAAFDIVVNTDGTVAVGVVALTASSRISLDHIRFVAA